MTFRRFSAANVHRLLGETKNYVERGDWTVAALRLGDLADQVAQIGADDPELAVLANDLRQWEETCNKHARGTGSRFAIRKWSEFVRNLQLKTDQWLGPFPTATQETRNDN
jgi:hypothetical protein